MMWDRLLSRLRPRQKNGSPAKPGPAGRSAQAVPDFAYRSPQDLALTPLDLRRVLLVGSCLTAAWPKIIAKCTPTCPVDFYLFNNMTQLPDDPPHPPEEYDFMIVQIPLRTLVPDNKYFRLNHADTRDHEELFAYAKERLQQALAETMRWNRRHNITAFVCNFLVPQQNPMGRLLPRYDLRNFVYFVECLNRALAEELASYPNAHFFDMDQVLGTYGKKYIQDDVIYQTNHGAAFSNTDFERDRNRLEPPEEPGKLYPTRVFESLRNVWAEITASYRTIRQHDSVKLVVVDLDDTLWRGLAGEKTGDIDPDDIQGWPIGLHDALGYLRQRGILLAIISKNDEAQVSRVWGDIVNNRLSLDDFAVRKINWLPKAQNLEEILREVNLLPKSVLYIDDNPVERESIKRAFPDVRVLGPTPYLWRRILLWSSETQVAKVTAESAVRSEMVRAQVERESQRQQLSREDFLASLSLEISLRDLHGQKDPKFARALELINKTNQFNTTGKRWTEREFVAALENGKIHIFDVKDKFTAYGTVGVVVERGSAIVQFVMSCRTAGMDAEVAAMAGIMRGMAERGIATIEGAFVETELNLLCRDFYRRCGFQQQDGHWQRASQPGLEPPAHIRMVDKIGK